MDMIKRDRNVSLVVFGCGVAFGIGGLFSYYQARRSIQKEIKSLNNSIDELKGEIEELRLLSTRGSPLHGPDSVPSRAAHKLTVRFADDLDGGEGYTSENDEFFDFPDSESQSPSNGMGIQVRSAPITVRDAPQTSSSSPSSPELDHLLSELDSLFEDPSVNKSALFNKVLQACEQYGRTADLVVRLTRASYNKATEAAKLGNKEAKKKYAFETVEFSKEGLELGPDRADCNKWYAIAIGGLNDYVTTKEKIENGSTFKKHVDIAISINPRDATLHHLLGRFCMEVAGLSWLERKIANTIFGEVPAATMADAVNHLTKAYELKPQWKENLQYLAKCCFLNKQPEEGKKWIQIGLDVPIKGVDDELAHNELLLFKSKYL